MALDVALWAAGAVSAGSLAIWLWLVFARAWFWRTDQYLEFSPEGPSANSEWPSVIAVVPARNEAEMLPLTLPGLLGQDYPGQFHIYLVDDRSEDGTATVAQQLAAESGAQDRLTVVAGSELPSGWAGKVWALRQGTEAAETDLGEYWLFVDADILLPPYGLRSLVRKAEAERLDLVSLMALLEVTTVWDRLLIPAFVYYFCKLYPFRRVNSGRHRTAAAAGGCVLLRTEALAGAGGLQRIASEIIDDCALARLVKQTAGAGTASVWLGLTRDVRSMRPYRNIASVWSTVARTAFAQLRYSLVLLLGTVLGLVVTYVVPPLTTLAGLVLLLSGGSLGPGLALTLAGILAWGLMSASLVPMLRWYRVSPGYAPLLPVTGVLYTLMTVDSARRYWRKKGGAWKGRTYGAVRL